MQIRRWEVEQFFWLDTEPCYGLRRWSCFSHVTWLWLIDFIDSLICIFVSYDREAATVFVNKINNKTIHLRPSCAAVAADVADPSTFVAGFEWPARPPTCHLTSRSAASSVGGQTQNGFYFVVPSTPFHPAQPSFVLSSFFFSRFSSFA